MDQKYVGETGQAQIREERMRYEVLDMLYRISNGDPDCPVNCRAFAEDIGVWREEVFRAIDYLDRVGLVRYCGAGPILCITETGKEVVEEGFEERRVRDTW